MLGIGFVNAQQTCTDSDGGKNYSIKGVVGFYCGGAGPGGNCFSSDSCLTKIKLRETYCSINGFEEEFFNCSYGCEDGLCLQEEQSKPILESNQSESINETACTDTDGGINIYEKGYVEHEAYGEMRKEYDRCESGEVIDEFYCNEGIVNTKELICPNGCQDGACIEQPTTHKYIIKKDFRSIKYEGIQEGEVADTIDVLSTWFSGFVDGAFSRYTLSEISAGTTKTTSSDGSTITYDVNYISSEMGISIAEFGHKITFEEFNKNYVSKFKTEAPNALIEYDGASSGVLNAMVLLIEDSSTMRDGSIRTSLTISWVSENKFITLNVDDRSSVSFKYPGGTQNRHDFVTLINTYMDKHPSTLVPEIITPTGETGPIKIPKEKNEGKKIAYVCQGCELDDKCYPLGYRKNKKYCSDNNEFINQVEKKITCENNFECSSNVCVSGECISEGLIKKILNWFRRLFG